MAQTIKFEGGYGSDPNQGAIRPREDDDSVSVSNNTNVDNDIVNSDEFKALFGDSANKFKTPTKSTNKNRDVIITDLGSRPIRNEEVEEERVEIDDDVEVVNKTSETIETNFTETEEIIDDVVKKTEGGEDMSRSNLDDDDAILDFYKHGGDVGDFLEDDDDEVVSESDDEKNAYDEEFDFESVLVDDDDLTQSLDDTPDLNIDDIQESFSNSELGIEDELISDSETDEESEEDIPEESEEDIPEESEEDIPEESEEDIPEESEEDIPEESEEDIPEESEEDIPEEDIPEEDIPDEAAILDSIVDDVTEEPILEQEIQEEATQANSEIQDVEFEVVKPEEKEVETGGSEWDNYNVDNKSMIISMFNNSYTLATEQYKEKDVVKYLNNFKDVGDNMKIISSIYSDEMVKFGRHIDFKNDKTANDKLWVIVACKFADHIIREKQSGNIETIVEVRNLQKTELYDVIDDENIVEMKLHKKKENDKYEKYKLDRTVFEIANDEEESVDSSIFEDSRPIEKDFYESIFYKILTAVMEPDARTDMTKVRMKTIINSDTAYIPIVDFSTGIRLVCVDVTDVDQYQMNPMLMSSRIPFSFPLEGGPRSVRLRMLYSDNCKYRPNATVYALKKLIAYNFIKDRYKTTISDNYVTAYTTDRKYVDLFEYGDPDSKARENSTYFCDKPHNAVIGIIVLDKKSESDRQAMRRNQVRNQLRESGNLTNEVTVDGYDIHFVLSARYICNDRRLSDISLDQNSRYVEYIITQYTECQRVLIMDGLQTIITAIVKEHFEKYGKNTKYSVEFELDRDNLLTPAVLGMIENMDGIEPSTYRRVDPKQIQASYCLPPSRMKLDGVLNFEKGRLDRRLFTPRTIQSRYEDVLWKRYNLGTNEGINEFIKSRGFEEFWTPHLMTFDIMPYALNAAETSNLIMNLRKVSMESLMDRNSDDTDNLLMEQKKKEYFKKMDGSGMGTLQKFMFMVLDVLSDIPTK